MVSELVPGLVGEAEAIVAEADTAERLGSGTVPVLGTPALVGLMEHAAVQALEGISRRARPRSGATSTCAT